MALFSGSVSLHPQANDFLPNIHLLKLLHVIISIDPILGGVSQAVRTMIHGLAETQKMENEVVSLDPPDSDFLRDDPFTVHSLGQASGPWGYNSALIPWLQQNLPRFDAVILHGLWQYHAYAVRRAMKQLRPSPSLPKIYIMPHGMLDPYFQSDPARRLKALRNVIYWKLVEGETVNGADGLLFTCEDEKLLARKPFMPYQPKQELVIGLGVEEPPAFTDEMKFAFQAACPLLGHRPYFLFLSRIHQKKGVDLLIKAYVILAEKFKLEKTDNNLSPIRNFPDLVIAGPIDSTYAKEMLELAGKLLPASEPPVSVNSSTMLSPKIHFPGMLRENAKWGAFHGCNAFILPSHQENFGIAVVEALACGKPVMISDKVNIWREITETGAGIVEADNLSGCQELLMRFVHMSSIDKEKMGRHALACYQTRFGVRVAADRLAEAVI